jgi:hypothetical protein
VSWHDHFRAYTPTTFGLLALPWLLITVGVLLLDRRRRPLRSGSALHADPLLTLAGLAALATLATCTAAFAFIHDDFGYLLAVARHPWAFDQQLRLLGVEVPFWLAVHSGAPMAAFIVMDSMAVILCALVFAAALADAGWSRSAAALSALLFIASEPVMRLAIWAAGLQQLLVWSLVFGILAAVRRAVREAGTPRVWGWASIAMGLGGLATFCKWPVAWIAVPSAWLWAAGEASSPPARRARWMLPLGVAVMIGLPIAVELPGSAPGDGGISRLAVNLLDALGRMLSVAFMSLLAFVAATVLATGTVRECMRRLRASLIIHRDTLGRALAMAALSIVPFLFNMRYFAEYYVGPATAWLAAAAAPLLMDAVPAQSRRGWAAATLVVLLWFPVQTMLSVSSAQSPGHTLAVWLEEVHEAIAHQAPPQELTIDAACATDAATRESRQRLEQFFELSEHGLGVRWIANWPNVPVEMGRSRAPHSLQLRYCNDGVPHVSVEPSATDVQSSS